MLSETILYEPGQIIYVKRGIGENGEELTKIGMSTRYDDSRCKSYRSDSNFSLPKTKSGDRRDEEFLKGFLQEYLGYELYRRNRSTENFLGKADLVFDCFDNYTLGDMYRLLFEKYLKNPSCYFFDKCTDEVLRRALIYYYDGDTKEDILSKISLDTNLPLNIRLRGEYLFS